MIGSWKGKKNVEGIIIHFNELGFKKKNSFVENNWSIKMVF
jgi:hypothetical protein